MIKRSRDYNKKNHDKYIEWKRNYYYENKKHENDRKQKWVEENRGRQQEYFSNWQKENKDKIKEYQLYRTANKTHDITENEWEECLKYFNYSCAYCGIDEEISKESYGQRLHKEHVDHYGSNDLSNNIPSCKICNSRKRTKSLEQFAKDYNIDDENLNKILKWITEDFSMFVEI